jgi:hypothetical protein
MPEPHDDVAKLFFAPLGNLFGALTLRDVVVYDDDRNRLVLSSLCKDKRLATTTWLPSSLVAQARLPSVLH